MFGNFFDKKKDNANEEAKEHLVIVDKISKMNLTELRDYVNNKLKSFEITEDGLRESMKKLVLPDEKTGKRYLLMDDMDSKKKKAFDLVLLVGKSKKITIETVELIQDFTFEYEELINQYDEDFKEIYSSRLKDIISHALANMHQLTEFKNKMSVLGE